jgi:four helix bundle protein
MTNAPPMTKEGQMTNDEARGGVVAGEPRKTYDLEERSAKFGEEVIRFCRGLKLDAVTEPLVRQIIKSSTSVGANYCEADDAVSRKEFRQKIGTCKKESRETKHWLRMIAAAEPAQAERARVLWKEANELLLIFATIFRKLTEKKTPARGKAS